MKILFIDTETTGLPQNYRAPVTDTENWPRMIQLAYILTDEEKAVSTTLSAIIKPEGFQIPEEATAIHGITQQRAEEDGLPLKGTLEHLSVLIAEADLVVGHNISFDRKIVGAEMIRCEMEDLFHGKPRICTMHTSTAYCNIIGRTGRVKWPTLQELYSILFGRNMPDAHDAYADVMAARECFFELRARGVITDEMIQQQLNFKPVEGF